jgi:hypothetical protein
MRESEGRLIISIYFSFIYYFQVLMKLREAAEVLGLKRRPLVPVLPSLHLPGQGA